MVRRPGPPPPLPRDPADWHWSVRRADGAWLSRPEAVPDAPPSNAETWTRRIPDAWSFDSQSDAERAARSHGAVDGEFTVHAAPRRGGEWLKGEGAYGPRPVSRAP